MFEDYVKNKMLGITSLRRDGDKVVKIETRYEVKTGKRTPDDVVDIEVDKLLEIKAQLEEIIINDKAKLDEKEASIMAQMNNLESMLSDVEKIK